MPTQQEMVAARATLRSAVEHGGMKRAEVCEQCGGKPKYDRIQAHHDDYSKPLEVRWLCRSCHGRHHAALRKAQQVSA